ncbi:MAG: amino acid ABC transporter permease [Ruminococcaceae bacterium]|nr:amino acid ABC transporter permease [Oscillospiraceae bacterium]
MQEFISAFGAKFYSAFIDGNRWQLYLGGIWVTIKLTAFAMLIGCVLGVLVASVRATYDLTEQNRRGFLLRLLNGAAKFYITVIRGTPLVVQLLIIYFVIFSNTRNQMAVAVIAFGVNSGAYVAEMVRGGIMSVDKGQMEAGRSLGLSYGTTMRLIIIPQAVKTILPALGNEFIALLKETSIVTVIGLRDLTKAAMLVGAKTYDYFLPYIAIALIYLLMVIILTWLLGKLERRLRSSER